MLHKWLGDGRYKPRPNSVPDGLFPHGCHFIPLNILGPNQSLACFSGIGHIARVLVAGVVAKRFKPLAETSFCLPN
jgi:hypothetical protein